MSCLRVSLCAYKCTVVCVCVRYKFTGVTPNGCGGGGLYPSFPVCVCVCSTVREWDGTPAGKYRTVLSTEYYEDLQSGVCVYTNLYVNTPRRGKYIPRVLIIRRLIFYDDTARAALPERDPLRDCYYAVL